MRDIRLGSLRDVPDSELRAALDSRFRDIERVVMEYRRMLGRMSIILDSAPTASDVLTWDNTENRAVWSPTAPGGSAPAGAEYLTSSADATLTAEKVFQSGTNTTFTTAAATAQVDVANASETARGVVELATSAETDAGLAVQASDTRLSDARTPTSHGSSAHTGNILPGGANQDLGDAYMDFGDIAAPANPAAGVRRVFTNSATGELSVRTSAGSTVSLEGAGGGGDGTNTAEGAAYHPDRAPASGSTNETFDGAEDQTWSWANQDLATATILRDGLILDGNGSNNQMHVRYFPAPSTGDWLWAVKMVKHTPIDAIAAEDGGIIVLTGGTKASPSKVHIVCYAALTGSVNFDYRFRSATSYAFAGLSEIGNSVDLNELHMGHYIYFAAKFTDSSNDIEALVSFNGVTWASLGTNAGSTDAPEVGIFVRGGTSKYRFEWARLITDATAITDLAVGS